ncbi:TDP-N-acetylfucosamine:lipid II N-acetylfucosaminyltransferase [Pseudomonas sp. TH21]|nr:TDP-N-acetylfucosamine:lipid II N-acetylfucosaminyltransferase [Pseudomonas sp. TH21]
MGDLGGDLYQYNEPRNRKWTVMEFFRRPVIRSLAHIVTYIPGDYELAVKWYGAKAAYHECVMYPSNVFVGDVVSEKGSEVICVQAGNSADPGNYHFEILDKLSAYKGAVEVFVPLSYGDEESARQVIDYGAEVFGGNFHALTKLMSFEEYMSYLSKVDIAIFNHRRQQAMGNTISLLGMGKKVFIRSDVTPWRLFVSQGLIIGDVENFDLSLLTPDEARYNSDIIRETYSFDRLYSQWKGVFDGR